MEPITRCWELYLTSPRDTIQPNCSLMDPSPDISIILRERRMRFAGHRWRAKQRLAGDLLLWSPNHGKRRVGRPAITYIDQLCRDTGCLLNDLPALLQDSDGWSDRLVNARAISTWWWRWWRWWWWMEGWEEGYGFFCSPKVHYLRTMSQKFSRRL